MTKTKIEWSERVWNPITGCSKVSPGCDNCYAIGMSKRLQAMAEADPTNVGAQKYLGTISGDDWSGMVSCHPEQLEKPLTWQKPRLVFVKSMADLFHEMVNEEFIQRVFAVMRQANKHTFQILTKRSKRLKRLSPKIDWPPNVWMGVSVERQEYIYRIKDLAATNAAVKFVSMEPLLGAIDAEYPESIWPDGPPMCCDGRECGCRGLPIEPPLLHYVDWVIVGGESGPGARPMDEDRVRDIRDQCVQVRVPFFYKQKIVNGKKCSLPMLDGRVWDEMPEVKQ